MEFFIKTVYNFKKFDSKKYLDEYHSNFSFIEKRILNFLHDFYSQLPDNRKLELLEIGGGPTVYQLISASKKVNSIVFSEFLKANRREVEKFINNSPAAFNWDKYFAYVAKLEKNHSLENLKARLRSKIIKVISCDLNKAKPVTLRKKFDIVSVHFCPESITSQEDKFVDYMENFFKYVKPGGWLVMGLLRQTHGYSVGKVFFPAFFIKKDYLEKLLKKHGFYNINIKEIIFKLDGINGNIMLSAQKSY